MKDKFFCVKAEVWNESTQKKSEGKTQDSLEIVNQRGSFSLNILKSIFSDWGLF